MEMTMLVVIPVASVLLDFSQKILPFSILVDEIRLDSPTHYAVVLAGDNKEDIGQLSVELAAANYSLICVTEDEVGNLSWSACKDGWATEIDCDRQLTDVWYSYMREHHPELITFEEEGLENLPFPEPEDLESALAAVRDTESYDPCLLCDE